MKLKAGLIQRFDMCLMDDCPQPFFKQCIVNKALAFLDIFCCVLMEKVLMNCFFFMTLCSDLTVVFCRKVSPHEAETAGAIMAFFLSLGLALGAGLSFGFRAMI